MYDCQIVISLYFVADMDLAVLPTKPSWDRDTGFHHMIV